MGFFWHRPRPIKRVTRWRHPSRAAKRSLAPTVGPVAYSRSRGLTVYGPGGTGWQTRSRRRRREGGRRG